MDYSYFIKVVFVSAVQQSESAIFIHIPPFFWIYSHVGHRAGEGNGTLLQYSCLGNPMDGGAWSATVHRVAKRWTRLSDFTFTFHFSLFTFMHWRRKWQPTPVFLPGESQGQRSLVGCYLWGHIESDPTEVT